MVDPIWANDPFRGSDFFQSSPGAMRPGEPFEPQPSNQDGYFVDSLKGIGRGVAGAAESVLEIPTILPGIDYDVPDNFGLGHSHTLPGSLLEGTVQFLAGFVPITGAASRLTAVGKAGRIASKMSTAKRTVRTEEILKRAGLSTKAVKARQYGQSMASGALADFLVFADDEERLSNMLREIPGLDDNMLLEFLAQDDDDSALESRLKNVLEGAGLGLMVDGAVRVLKGIGRRFKIANDPTMPEARKRQALEENEAQIAQDAEEALVTSDAPEFRADASEGLDDDYVGTVETALNVDRREAEAVVALQDAMGIERDSVQWVRGGEAAEDALDQAAFHGSPHKFDRFSTENIGSGEGHQAYGWGLYFAGDKKVAEFYKDALSRPDRAIIDITSLRETPSEEVQAGLDAIQTWLSRDLKRNPHSYQRGRKPDAFSLKEEFTRDRDEAQAALDSGEHPNYRGKPLSAQDRKWYEEQVEASNQALRVLDDYGFYYYVETTSQGYKVELAPEADEFLDLDAVLDDQAPEIARKLQSTDWYAGVADSLEDRADAAGFNPTGLDLIRFMEEEFDPREVSKLLLDAGIRGNKYLDGNSRRSGKGSLNYVIFDDADVEITGLFQNGRKRPKGSVEFSHDSQALIRGFDASDVSTGTHELAHVARRRFVNLDVEAKDRLGITDDDIKVAEEWSGVKDGKWTVEAEEKFAVGFERYMRDGRAPDVRLENLFSAMRTFLVDVYKKLRGSPVDIRISPEMREVFDKLVTRDLQTKRLSPSQELADKALKRAEQLEARAAEKEADLLAEYGDLDEVPAPQRGALTRLRNRARAARDESARYRTVSRLIDPEPMAGVEMTPLQLRVREFAEDALEHGSMDPEQATRVVSAMTEALENDEDVLVKITGLVNTATLGSTANRKLALIYSASQKAADNAVDHRGLPLPPEQIGKNPSVDRPRGRGAEVDFEEASIEDASTRMWAQMVGRKPAEIAAWMKATAEQIGESSLNAMGFLKYVDRHMDDMYQLYRAAKGDPAALRNVGLTETQALDAFATSYREAAELFKGFGAIRREFGRGLYRLRFKSSKILTPEMIEAKIKDMGGRDFLLEQGDKLFEARRTAGEKNNMAALHLLSRFDAKARRSFMLNEYFVNFILSSVRTLSTNVLGNLGTTIYNPIESMIGARVAQGVQTLKGKNADNYAAEARRAFDQLAALHTQFSEALDWAQVAWKKKDYVLDPDAGTLDLPQEMRNAVTADNVREGFGAVPGIGRAVRDLDPEKGLGSGIEWFGNFLRLPSQALMATDEFFKQWNYRSSVTADLLFEGRKKLKNGEIDDLDAFVREELDAMTQRGQALTQRNLQIEANRRFSPDNPKYNHALGLEEMQADKRAWIQEQWGDPKVLNRGEIAGRALEKARYNTFTNDLDADNGLLSSVGVSMREFGNKHPLFRLFVPFIRTPLNILLYAGRRIAFPVINRDIHAAGEYLVKKRLGNVELDKLKYKLARELMSNDPKVVSEAYGRASAALGFTSVFMGFALNGMITGAGPRDKERRSLMREDGWQPYSLKIGNTYVSYQKLDPFATILGFYADFADAAKYASEEDMRNNEAIMLAGFVSILHNIESKSYLQGLVQISGLIQQPETALSKTGGRLGAALLTPSLIASLRDVTDPTMTEARGMLDQVFQRVPFLGSAVLDPQRNVIGEAVDRRNFDGAAEVAAGAANVFLPLLINRTSDDVVTRELAMLAHPFSLPQKSRYATDLTEYENADGQSAYDRWIELSGQLTLKDGKGKARTLKQTLRRLIQSRDYQALPVDGVSELDVDSPRVRAIQRVITRYRAVALQQMLNEFPEVRALARNQLVATQATRRGVSTDAVRAELFPLE
jgi:hypothetical protein